MNWNETWPHYSRSAPMRVNYLFLQFLIGRALDNARLNFTPNPRCADATGKLRFALENLFGQERRWPRRPHALPPRAVSSAPQELPVWGYRPRDKYGALRLPPPSPLRARGG